MDKVKMDAQREVSIMERAISTYGEGAQVDVAIEEMSELTKALLKFRRGGWNECSALYVDAIREEMADVSIMLSQLELIYGDVSDIEIEKLERLERRLDELGA